MLFSLLYFNAHWIYSKILATILINSSTTFLGKWLDEILKIFFFQMEILKRSEYQFFLKLDTLLPQIREN